MIVNCICTFRDCLHDHIMRFRDADVVCPLLDEEPNCKEFITEQEMKAVQLNTI